MKHHRFLRAWFPKALLSTLMVGMLLISAVQAQTVTTEGELSAAITAANVNNEDVTITLGDSIILTQALPEINKVTGTLTIEGGAHTLRRSSEAASFRVLTINWSTVTVNSLTISGGNENVGGGICVINSTLSLSNITLSGNTAALGGGMYTHISSIILTNSTLSGNTANTSLGGGIFADLGGSVDLTNCTVSANTSGEDGGGIGNYATMTLTNSTVSGNESGRDGGGIRNFATMTLINCTLSGNTANSADGGGVRNSGTMTLTNSTVCGNQAGHNGGGVYNGGALTLIRTIVSGNSADLAAMEIFRSAGSITGNAHNVFGHSELTSGQAYVGFTPGASDLNCTSDGGTATALSGILNTTLADNGGPTLTHALVVGSPAIDIASTGPANDQRGISRQQGSGFDAGAFEFGPSMSVDPTSLNFAAAGNMLNLALSANVSWTASVDAGSLAWLSLSADTGTDDATVSVTAAANSGLARSGTVTFSSTGLVDVTVAVSQSDGTVPPVDPTDPDPEPILEWNYSHSLVSNTAKLNAWVMDPEARLGAGANWVMEGDLSRGFRFVDGMLVGMFDTTGLHTFRISGTDGTIAVNHTFTVRVMVPTVCPTIFGAWIDGEYLSMELLEEARHGVAAQAAPMQMTLEGGQFTDIRFDWDYIKDGFSFRIIDGDLPPGLILDGNTGVISGVPSASGAYSFLVSVKDWRGRGYQWVEVNIY